MQHHLSRLLPFAGFFLAALGGSAQAAISYSGTGADAAAIQSTVTGFRSALGNLNANGPCDVGCVPGTGRREINWDGVPDGSSSPNAFSGSFFNQATGAAAGRIRGIQFSSPGTLEVSASTASGVPTLFGNHSLDNAADFAAFSPEKIFGIVGSNELDVTFTKPGAPGTAALVKGFGAVFTDVEIGGSTRMDFYGASNQLLQSIDVPPFQFGGGDSFKSFSFAGLVFDATVVARVHIVNGGFDLNLQQFGPDDSVAMDDFIYGEPRVVPEPSTSLMGLVGVAVLALNRRLVRR